MDDLPTNPLGRTGLEVTKLGYGALEFAVVPPPEPSEVEALLNEVLDCGINFIDTAPDYGRSEELIGQFLAGRREEFFLASKCGCRLAAIDGLDEHVFTPENVRACVEQSLQRMRTDYLDLLQVHVSPSRETLEKNATVETMEALRDEGKVRFLGMSGKLPHLPDHVAMGVFDAFQIPYSGVEREHEAAISNAAASGAGIIVRGGVAKGFPTTEQMLARIPDGRVAAHPEHYAAMLARFEAQSKRFARTGLDRLLDDGSPMEFMLRFAISHPDMHTAIVGTKNSVHLRANVEAARKGPLPADVYEEAKRCLPSPA